MQPSDRLTYGIAACIVLGLVILGWRMWSYQPLTEQQALLEATTTPQLPVDPSTLSLYSSGEFGVSFFYPAIASVASSTDSDTIAFVTVGETRLAVRAADESRQGRCIAAGPAERELGERNESGITWYGFARTALGTEQERTVVAYRALIDGRCFTVEESRPVISTTAESFIAIVLEGLTVADSERSVAQ